jgi:DNA-binding response OmpR family regulator
VLVIDDEKGIALALKMILKSAGYEVITAEDGVNYPGIQSQLYK